MRARNKLFILAVAALLMFSTCASVGPVGAATSQQDEGCTTIGTVQLWEKPKNHNPDCADTCGGTQVKIEKDFAGTHDVGGGRSITIVITKSKESEPTGIDWSSNFPVSCVIMKGGAAANVYSYDPPAKADCGLVTPINASDENAGISHITFCYTPVATTYDLQVSQSAQPSLTRTYNWDIEKTANPTTLNLAEGQSGEVEYTIAVTKSGPTDSGWTVNGTFSITNPAPFPVDISGLSVDLGEGITVNLTGQAPPYSLAAGGTANYSYTASVPDGADRICTIQVSTSTLNVNGDTSSLGVSFSGATVNVANAGITVDDSNGQTWDFEATGTEVYTQTLDCGDGPSYTNTATIGETGASSTATVAVSCKSEKAYQLGVGLSAQTSLTRTYDWGISKSVDKDRLRLASGQKGMVRYTISVTKSAPTDSKWAVSGQVTIHNPAPFDVLVTGVAVDLGAGVTAVVSGPALPYTLAAGGQLQYAYTAALPNGSARTGTVTVSTAPANVSGGSAGASISFAKAEVSEVRGVIHVDDTFGGPWAFGESDSVSYSETYDCGDKGKIHNTATIRETGQSAKASVKVECEGSTSPCVESAVTVIIHGGWAGIPVRAWVDGGEQPTRSTGLDSMGRPSATWTLYPPENGSWRVRVEPQIPAGWGYRLLRIESPTSGLQASNPAGAEVSVQRCNRYVVYYELVEQRTATAAVEEPVLLLPVTGAAPAPSRGVLTLVAQFVAWWRSLASILFK